MQFYRCKCGSSTAWTSMGVARCVACSKCGSDLAPGPDGHAPVEPHDYVTQYDQNTGVPYRICKRCMRREAKAEQA